MFWSPRSATQAQMLEIALQRLADGLPLPLEAANWPAPLNTTIPALASRLSELRVHLEALDQGQADLALLPETSGFSGLTTAVNTLQRKMVGRAQTLTALGHWLGQVEAGNYAYRVTDKDVGDDLLLQRINVLSVQLEQQHQFQRQIMLEAKTSEALAESLRGEHDIVDFGHRLLTQLCAATGGLTGAFYLCGDDGRYNRHAAHALAQRHAFNNDFMPGEGLLGQAVNEGQLVVLRELPANYLPLESGLAHGQPRQLLLWPIKLLGKPLAIVELASISEFSPWHLDWLRKTEESVAVVLGMALARDKMAVLLADSEIKNNELHAQQEEMRTQGEAMQQLNATLEEKNEIAMRLQAELEEKNEIAMRLQAKLEEKNELLSRQQAELEEHNEVLEQQKMKLRQRQEEVERASSYKSEFLANMSHELRTPLNSLLLLSGYLIDNEDGNLTEDQLESLAMIKKGGHDLLTLINDILDLSKIEAGQLKIIREPIDPATQLRELVTQLAPLAEHKSITLEAQCKEGLPSVIYSDSQRIAQILKNLISNAVKFTEQGGVTVRLSTINEPTLLPNGSTLVSGIRFEVNDTGLGIEPEHQTEVFEAFQQGDGSITRKYGGTGLGLAISRQLARRLGGDICLESTLGQGSCFTLLLPHNVFSNDGVSTEPLIAKESISAKPDDITSAAPLLAGRPLPASNPLGDDREQCAPGEHSLLLIEDDMMFARTVLKHIRKKGFKALAATSGNDGLALAAHFKPAGIVLDLGLPDLDGREVLEILKADSTTKDIPVHVVSSRDRDPKLFALGVVDIQQKPLNAQALQELLNSFSAVRGEVLGKLLVVEDDETTRITLAKALAKQPVALTFASSGAEALERLTEQSFDGMVLDLGLPDMNGRVLLEEMVKRELQLPVIVHTGRALDEAEYQQLRSHSDIIVLKGSEGGKRLLDEVALFVHGIQARMTKSSTAEIVDDGSLFVNKKILLVDDDMRNAFALNKVLRKHGLTVLLADDGQLALDKLAEHPDINLVLMDIMMPVLDGYEATRRIRADVRFKQLPIIALTAKAMSEDRDKCLAAGADDYLAKPIDVDKLLSLLRIYLVRGRS